MKLLELIPRYRAALAGRGLARTTLKTWCAWMRTYARHVDASGEGALSDFSAEQLGGWLLALSDQGLRPRTRRSAIAAMRSFGDWCLREKLVETNPAGALQPPKLDAPRRELVTDQEVRDLLAACDRIPNLRRAALARCALSILAYAGLRRCELLQLKVGDVSQPDKSLTVRNGKGSKARTLYPHGDCLGAVRAWMRERGVCKHDYLLDFDHARRIGDAGLRTLIEEVKVIAGHRGARNILPHSIRHNCATRLMQNGVDLESIRVFLGHADLATTAVYLHTNEQRLRGLAERSALETAAAANAPAEMAREARRGLVEHAANDRRARLERKRESSGRAVVAWRRGG